MEVRRETTLTQIIACLASPEELQRVNQLGEDILSSAGREIVLLDAKFLNQLLWKAGERAKQGREAVSVFVQAGAEDYWHPNELKSFTWVSVCLVYLTGRSLSEFEAAEYQIFALIFPMKSYSFLRYNHVSLMRPGSKVRKQEWSEGEIELLTQIIRQLSEIKWSRVSLELYQRSNEQFFRTSVQCREKWINHLKPSVKRGGWELEEDEQLLCLVLKCGAKWSLISRELEGKRTEHMIKNRYNSLVKRYKPKKFYKPIEYLLNNILKQLRRKILNRKNKITGKRNQLQSQRGELVKLGDAAVVVESEGESQRGELKDGLSQEERFMPISTFGVDSDPCLGSGEGRMSAGEEGEKCDQKLLENWQENQYYREDNWLDDDDADRMDLNYLKGRMLLCDMQPLHPTNFE